SIELIVCRDTPIVSASCPCARFRCVRNVRTRFFIAYGQRHPDEPCRRGRHRPRVPGHQVATTTAGTQPTPMMGSHLPCRIACTIELTATTVTAQAVITYIHRVHGFMTGPLPVKCACHRQVSLTSTTCQACLSLICCREAAGRRSCGRHVCARPADH